jgi:hypothetical protein
VRRQDILDGTKLTDDQKVQIFCAALAVTLQADPKPGDPMANPVKKAGSYAAEAIALLQSKAWAE